MVDIRKAFPRKYMSAIDLDGERLFAQIVSAEMTTFKPGEPPVLMMTLRHNGTAPNQVRCNQTNRGTLANAFGWDTDAWATKRLSCGLSRHRWGLASACGQSRITSLWQLHLVDQCGQNLKLPRSGRLPVT
jgi:hypothetical protein